MKTYYFWCHVCDKKYSKDMVFCSGPSTVKNGENLGVRAHDEHQSIPGLIRKSYEWYIKTGLPYSVAKEA